MDHIIGSRPATQKFVNRAREIVEENRDFLQSEWDRIQPVP